MAVGTAAAVGSIGSAIIGGLFSAWGASRQNKAAKSAAERQMAFQREMYGSRYQMTMADMRKAGLNPILAYKTGVGGSPGGSSYSPVNIGADGATGMQNAITSALAARRQNQELKNMRAQQKLLEEQKRRVRQQYNIEKPSENFSHEKNRLYLKGKGLQLEITRPSNAPSLRKQMRRGGGYLERLWESSRHMKKHPETWWKRK